jgi:alkylhydroperoxidase family enzyme
VFTIARIDPIDYESSDATVIEAFENQIAKNGRITNMKRTLLHSPQAFHALMEWYPLRGAAMEFLSEREFNLFAHGISTQNNCIVCSTFFRKILIDNGDDPDKPEFTARENVLIEFGRQCALDPNAVSDVLFSELGALFNEKQIVILTAFAGMMIATNLINSVLKVDLDEYLLIYTER